MALDDGDRSTKADGSVAAPPASDSQKDSKSPPQTESLLSRLGSFLSFSIFIIAPPALVLWCLTDLVLQGRWWSVGVVIGVSVVAAIVGVRLLGWLEAIPLWGTIAILTCVGLNMYDDFSKRKARRHVGALECSRVSCDVQLDANTELQRAVAAARVR